MGKEGKSIVECCIKCYNERYGDDGASIEEKCRKILYPTEEEFIEHLKSRDPYAIRD